MFIINKLWDVLVQLGVVYKNAKILILGLDNAGKTTLIHMLKTNKFESFYPNLYPCKLKYLLTSHFDSASSIRGVHCWKCKVFHV
jgi:GTP-binding protein SAR1